MRGFDVDTRSNSVGITALQAVVGSGSLAVLIGFSNAVSMPIKGQHIPRAEQHYRQLHESGYLKIVNRLSGLKVHVNEDSAKLEG